jgi:PAS domain S-box-containing protein
MPNALSEAFCNPAQLLAAYFSASPIGLAVFDTRLRYQAINSALAEINGFSPKEHIGKTIRQLFGNIVNEKIEPVMLEVVRSGKPVLNMEFEFSLPRREEPGFFSNNFFPLKDGSGRVTQMGALVVEITEQKKLEAANLSLTNRLVRLRDEERRRIARELHDTTGQNLTGLIMNLASLKQSVSKLDAKFRNTFSESLELAKQSSREVRTLSYVLHPPMLDDFGLSDTLPWYVRGFTERSGIAVELQLSKKLPRLPSEMEMALFYVIQESLSNIRHSKNKSVRLSMCIRKGCIALEVQDFGKKRKKSTLTIKAPSIAGVGIPSMRERLKQFGGELQIASAPTGTLVRAVIPFRSRH